MNAGFRSNVIPGSAEATINVRMIPGTDPNDLVEEFQRVIADPRVDVKLANQAASPRARRFQKGPICSARWCARREQSSRARR